MIKEVVSYMIENKVQLSLPRAVNFGTMIRTIIMRENSPSFCV